MLKNIIAQFIQFNHHSKFTFYRNLAKTIDWPVEKVERHPGSLLLTFLINQCKTDDIHLLTILVTADIPAVLSILSHSEWTQDSHTGLRYVLGAVAELVAHLPKAKPELFKLRGELIKLVAHCIVMNNIVPKLSFTRLSDILSLMYVFLNEDKEGIPWIESLLSNSETTDELPDDVSLGKFQTCRQISNINCLDLEQLCLQSLKPCHIESYYIFTSCIRKEFVGAIFSRLAEIGDISTEIIDHLFINIVICDPSNLPHKLSLQGGKCLDVLQDLCKIDHSLYAIELAITVLRDKFEAVSLDALYAWVMKWKEISNRSKNQINDRSKIRANLASKFKELGASTAGIANRLLDELSNDDSLENFTPTLKVSPLLINIYNISTLLRITAVVAESELIHNLGHRLLQDVLLVEEYFDGCVMPYVFVHVFESVAIYWVNSKLPLDRKTVECLHSLAALASMAAKNKAMEKEIYSILEKSDILKLLANSIKRSEPPGREIGALG